MENNMETGLMLLAVGMSTVLLVLIMIVAFGKYLILLVNKLPADEEDSTPVRQSVATSGQAAADQSAMAAISAAVQSLSKGSAKVTRIEKL